jgi:hypothetical protein
LVSDSNANRDIDARVSMWPQRSLCVTQSHLPWMTDRGGCLCVWRNCLHSLTAPDVVVGAWCRAKSHPRRHNVSMLPRVSVPMYRESAYPGTKAPIRPPSSSTQRGLCACVCGEQQQHHHHQQQPVGMMLRTYLHIFCFGDPGFRGGCGE